MTDDQLELPGTRSPLVVIVDFNDTSGDEKVRVGRMLINERGLAIVVGANGRETLGAHVGVLKMCEELRAASVDKSDGERTLTALTHAVARMVLERYVAEHDDQ